MMTLEHRLATVVSLLPPGEMSRFAGRRKPQESIDARLADAIRALATTEGLICMTEAEFSGAVLQKAVERGISVTKPADEGLAARFAAIRDPRAQTVFWRSLTAAQRAEILRPAKTAH